MLERAARLEAENNFKERLTVYLPLKGTFASSKQKEVDAKVSEMSDQGWVYLKASGVGFKAIKSWGGALNLHFARA